MKLQKRKRIGIWWLFLKLQYGGDEKFEMHAAQRSSDDVMFAKSQEIFLIEDLKMHMSISSALQVIWLIRIFASLLLFQLQKRGRDEYSAAAGFLAVSNNALGHDLGKVLLLCDDLLIVGISIQHQDPLFLQNLKNTTHFLCATPPRHARSDVVGRRPLDQHPVQYSECVLTNCSWPRTQHSSCSKEQYIEIQTNTEVYCTLHWAYYSLFLCGMLWWM